MVILSIVISGCIARISFVYGLMLREVSKRIEQRNSLAKDSGLLCLRDLVGSQTGGKVVGCRQECKDSVTFLVKVKREGGLSAVGCWLW